MNRLDAVNGEHRVAAMNYLDLTIRAADFQDVSIKDLIAAYSMGFQCAANDRNNQKLRAL
jgi:hypothetical protein